MCISKRATQEQVEKIIGSLLNVHTSPECQMAVSQIIKASEGLTKSIRVCVQEESHETPELIEDFKRIRDELNGELGKIGASGGFFWQYESGIYTIWYSHDWNTSWHKCDREVGDLTGKNFTLNVQVVKSTDGSKVSVILDSDNSGDGIRPTKSCELSVALETVIRLHRLMPNMKTNFSIRGETKQAEVDDIILFLLRSREGHNLLEKDR